MKITKIIYFLVIVFAFFLIGCSEKNKLGPYGSIHSHADFKVYILGNPLNFDSSRYQVMEDLTHIENNDGDLLHVHVTGMTLGYFLQSIGLNLNNECITTDTGNQYCSLGKATLKVYTKNQFSNWVQIYDHADYVINELDKILVTYGSEDEEQLKIQQASVTDKALVT